MKFKKTDGGLLLSSKDCPVLGWVLTTINNKFTFDLPGYQNDVKPPVFDTEQEAKTALIEKVKE